MESDRIREEMRGWDRTWGHIPLEAGSSHAKEHGMHSERLTKPVSINFHLEERLRVVLYP